MKKLKIRIKNSLILKIAKLRKEIKIYKNRITQDVLKEQQYIDEMNILQGKIRELLLKLPKEERELWLRTKGENHEGHSAKTKRTKK